MKSDDPEDDPTHLATRSALGPVLEAVGVVRIETDATTRTWTFEDGLAVDERRHQHVAWSVPPRRVDGSGTG